MAQPAVVVTSLAALAVLRASVSFEFGAVAGHSVGEYAAYVAADVFDAEAALRLVNVRARAMADRVLERGWQHGRGDRSRRGAAAQACAAASQDGSSVEVANLNAPGQPDRFRRPRSLGKTRRPAPKKLARGGSCPSTSAARSIRCICARRGRACSGHWMIWTLQPARIPVVVNATAEPDPGAGALRNELAVQVYSPVRWVATLQRLAALGCDRFLEVGPGNVVRRPGAAHPARRRASPASGRWPICQAHYALVAG